MRPVLQAVDCQGWYQRRRERRMLILGGLIGAVATILFWVVLGYLATIG